MNAIFSKNILWLIFLTLPITGCKNDTEQPYPSAWPPLNKPKLFESGDNCPNLSGKYKIAAGPFYSLVSDKFSSRYRGHIVWKYAEILPASENSMAFKLTSTEQYNPIVFASIPQQEGKNYSCKKGWMRFPAKGNLSDFKIESFFMEIAADQEGNLVIRTAIQDKKEIDGIGVWCGDGCKSIPLPFTIKTYSTFTKWDRWEKASSVPHSLPFSEFPHPVWRQQQKLISN